MIIHSAARGYADGWGDDFRLPGCRGPGLTVDSPGARVLEGTGYDNQIDSVRCWIR